MELTRKNNLQRVLRLAVKGALWGMCVLSCPQDTYAQDKSDSLKKRLLAAPKDTNAVKTINQLAEQLWRSGDFEASRKYADSALVLSKDLGYKKGQAVAFNNMGVACDLLGLYTEAIRHYNDALRIGLEIKDRKITGSAYNNIGIIYYKLGNYPEALTNYFEALHVREAAGNKRAVAATYGNIGGVYMEQGNYQEALRNQLADLKIARELQDTDLLVNVYNNIGLIHYHQHNYTAALGDFFACLEIVLKADARQEVASLYSNIGLVYYEQGNYREAYASYRSSYQMRKALSDRHGLSVSLINLSEVTIKMKQLNEARRYLDSGLAIARDLQYKEIIKSAYSGLQTLDSMAGDYPAALKDYKLFIQYRDSLVNEANTKRSVQLQMQYEFDKKQAADSIQNAERLAQEELHHSQEISQQRMYTYGGAAGFLLMLVVAGISFNAYRQKQKANAIITEQKSLVEEKQKEILDSIYYARRIQRSLLPSERYIQRVLEKTRRY